ncbi:hypothetical protein [Pirellulimonas nuda]|uniref:hypothetical protein n=1 Tax=Pirellulimonas nuda TaxID=2528009 RepID=UPI0018D30D0A
MCGKEVEIVTHRWKGAAESVVIVAADGTRCLIPRWMLDAGHCATLQDEESPRIALAALCALRELIDAQPLPCDLSADTRGVSRTTFQGGPTDAFATISPQAAQASLEGRPPEIEADAETATRSGTRSAEPVALRDHQA